jgi:hypothetical protein
MDADSQWRPKPSVIESHEQRRMRLLRNRRSASSTALRIADAGRLHVASSAASSRSALVAVSV